MSFTHTLTEDRRLVILRLLREVPGYATNGAIIQGGLGPFGHRVSRDQVHTDLSWLEEQGLVTVAAVDGGRVRVATLTLRGADVATGAAVVPGVKRPSPTD